MAQPRKLLEEHLDEAIPEGRWSEFVTGYPEGVGTYLDRTEAGEEDALSRLAEAWDVFRKVGRHPRSPRVTVKVNDPRWSALGEILAMRAGRDADVTRFRGQYLDSGLIEPTQVETWIRGIAQSDGPPTTWVRVPLEGGGQPVSIEPLLAAGKLRVESELLEYQIPDSGWKRLIPIRQDGTLWQLRKTARRLTAQFGWPEATAVTFILTSVAPERPYTFGYTEHLGEIVPAANRLDLQVNPRAVSPEDLITAYRVIRSNIIGGSDQERRVRRLEKKAARLAVFWEETEGMALPERRAEWNRRHPQWKYPDPGTNFGRDGRTAHRSVVGEEHMTRLPRFGPPVVGE